MSTPESLFTSLEATILNFLSLTYYSSTKTFIAVFAKITMIHEKD